MPNSIWEDVAEFDRGLTEGFGLEFMDEALGVDSSAPTKKTAKKAEAPQ